MCLIHLYSMMIAMVVIISTSLLFHEDHFFLVVGKIAL